MAQLCWAASSQLRHVSTIRKKLVKQQYLLQTSSQYGELGPLTAEIGLPAWGTPANFNQFRVLASLLQWCRSPEANQTLHDLWSSPGLVHGIFWGFCPLMELCYVQNSLYVQVLRSRILAALLHSTPAVGLSETLRHGTRNGITQLLQRAPPIFGSVAMILGIGLHSSYVWLSYMIGVIVLDTVSVYV